MITTKYTAFDTFLPQYMHLSTICGYVVHNKHNFLIFIYKSIYIHMCTKNISANISMIHLYVPLYSLFRYQVTLSISV